MARVGSGEEAAAGFGVSELAAGEGSEGDLESGTDCGEGGAAVGSVEARVSTSGPVDASSAGRVAASLAGVIDAAGGVGAGAD